MSLTMKRMVALIAAISLAGCVESSSTLSVSGFSTETARVQCEKIFDCCNESEREQQLSLFDSTTEEECVTSYSAFIGGLVTPAIEASIAAGRVTYDGDAAQSCINQARATSCTSFFNEGDDAPTDCPGMITPLVAASGACSQDYECTTGHCAKESGADEGVCGNLPGEGESCEFECATGLYCDFTAGSVCLPRNENGAGCTINDACLSDYCEDGENGRFCADPPASTPVCTGG